MPSFRMMAFRVVRCNPRRVAAVLTTLPLSRSTRTICSRSTCSSVAVPADSRELCRISANGARRLAPVERITARSMKFSSSRTFPGQCQLTRARIVSDGILSIWPSIVAVYFFLKGQRSTQAGSRGKDHRAFNEVLELPYVSRPMPAYQSAHRVGRNLIDLAVHLCGIFLREMPGEYGYVLRPIAQRRGRDRKDFQPIVEIASEEFIPHHLGEIPVGCRHQPDVNGNGLSAAQALKLLLL